MNVNTVERPLFTGVVAEFVQRAYDQAIATINKDDV